MRGRLRQIPRPLALLLPVVALFGVTWALIVPAWGAPDEDAHFGYVQSLTERGELPDDGEEPQSTEQRLSLTYTNTDAVTFFGYAKPEWSPVAESAWRVASNGARRDNGGSAKNATAGYPPAYYLYEALGYEVAQSGDVLTRLYVMRLLSVVWLLVTAVGAWLLAGELFGRARELQLLTASAVGLWPMLSFISSSINPDALLIACWTLFTWLGVSVLRRGVEPARLAGMFACVGVALVTKATALALLPAAAFVLVVVALRLRHRVSARRVLVAASTLLALALPVVAWLLWADALGRPPYQQTALVSASASGGGAAAGAASHGASVSEFLAYIWHFYLPRFPGQGEISFVFPVISGYPAFQVWLASGWASFGWANVWFDPAVYYVFLALVLAAVAGATLTAVRALRRRGARGRWALLAAFLVLDAGALIAGLHLTDYNMYVDGKAPFMQGRYLLPVGALAALVLAQATRALPVRARTPAVAAVLAGLVAFQIACLGLVASRYYA